MHNVQMVPGGGGWWRRAAVPLLGGVILGVAAARAEPAPTGFHVPEEVRVALGWKPAPEGNYQPYRDGSLFEVSSEPALWPGARELARAWAEKSPAPENDPTEYLLRRLAFVEALALGAADREAADALRAQRATLAGVAAKLRQAKSDDGSEWQTRNVAEQVQQLVKTLGDWLADSPEERVRVFREELAANRPAGRAEIAARYGGEERLAELIKLVREHEELTAAHAAAEQDTTKPEAERKLAIRKAAGALGYFYGFNGEDRDFQRAMQDPDVTGAAGGASLDHRSVNVPDLVAWVGEAEAEKLLIETYALPVTVHLGAEGRTGGLARRMLEEGRLAPARLPWSLVSWRGATVSRETAEELVALFDGLKGRFPEMVAAKAGDADWNRDSGLAAVAYALAIAGRMDEAVALLKQVGAENSGLPYGARITEDAAAAAWDLVARITADNDNAEGWTRLESLAGPAKRGAELTAFAAKKAGEAKAGSELAKVWRMRHGWALIGEEKVEEGLAILTAGLEERPKAEEKLWSAAWVDSAGRILRLAEAVSRADLVKAWGEKLAADFKTPAGMVWDDYGLFDEFAEHQLAAGNLEMIEAMLRARLAAPQPKPSSGGMLRMSEDDVGVRPVDRLDTTLKLADVLGRQGRHADVVALLAESPDWGQTDIARMLGRSGGGAWRSLALVAAESLQETGRSEEAVRILEAALIESPGSDPLYALYTRIQGAKAMSFLEKMWAADRFQERPLIWLASLQLAAGEVAKAEATIKQAIATDPSDGEQPKGDRMRAYAVLREVALKQGDTKQAAFLADVLAAIRRSEDADDLANAGLVSRAITEYQAALESFSDAYCIQSRVARQLAEENRAEEAAEHYKRAFELMPDSFGRVESHCFGCEKAFAGEEAQSIAETVFLGLAEKPGAKPQVYYLLGYLRMEQERWEEAAGYFTKAVEADPDYLNAWSKLGEVLPHTLRPRAESDRVVFRLLALDPSGRRGGSGASEVRDLPALWKAYAEAGSVAPQAPDQVYPLGDKAKRVKSRGDHQFYVNHERPEAKTPAARLAKHEVLQHITRTLDTIYQWKESVR